MFRSRRKFLFESCGGLSGLGLACLLEGDGLLKAEGPGNKKPHFPARAKSVISLFMSGGVSHMDTFDPKPALTKYAGWHFLFSCCSVETF